MQDLIFTLYRDYKLVNCAYSQLESVNMSKKTIISALLLMIAGIVCLIWALQQQHQQMCELKELNAANPYWENVDKQIQDHNSINPLLKIFMRSNMKVLLSKQYENKAVKYQNADTVFSISLALMITGAGLFILVSGKFTVRNTAKIARKIFSKFRRENQQMAKTVFTEPDRLLSPEETKDPSAQIAEAEQDNLQQSWQKKKKYLSAMETVYNPEPKQDVAVTVQQQNSKIEEMIKQQFESLEKQISEVRRLNSDSRAAVEENGTETDALKQLTRQMAAINDFASKQQEKVKKLQEGYDWNIIKNFTLKIIRCIDNLQASIDKLKAAEQDTAILEETRDDFLFALESSGVEQFWPDINSDYRGQEKSVEAIAQKQYSPESVLKGKIASVIRPGYKFVIDDGSFKIVRTAQVKIYG